MTHSPASPEQGPRPELSLDDLLLLNVAAAHELYAALRGRCSAIYTESTYTYDLDTDTRYEALLSVLSQLVNRGSMLRQIRVSTETTISTQDRLEQRADEGTGVSLMLEIMSRNADPATLLIEPRTDGEYAVFEIAQTDELPLPSPYNLTVQDMRTVLSILAPEIVDESFLLGSVGHIRQLDRALADTAHLPIASEVYSPAQQDLIAEVRSDGSNPWSLHLTSQTPLFDNVYATTVFLAPDQPAPVKLYRSESTADDRRVGLSRENVSASTARMKQLTADLSPSPHLD